MACVIRIIMQYRKENDHAIDENCEEQVLPNCTLYYKGKWKYLAVYLENSLWIDLPDVLLFPVISFPFAAHIQGYRRHAWHKRQYNRHGLLLECPKSTHLLLLQTLFFLFAQQTFININFTISLIHKKHLNSINKKIYILRYKIRLPLGPKHLPFH